MGDAGLSKTLHPGPTGAIGPAGATLTASWLLAGWAGLALSASVGAATWWWAGQHRYRGAPVVAAFTLFFAATCGLAAGPWRSPTGYRGFDWWVQGLAVAAVAVTMWRSVFDQQHPE